MSDPATTKNLIINADDFGIGHRVTDGIVESFRNGVVTSTTVMANMPATEYACKLAQDLPALGIGVHLNLTRGSALSNPETIPDLATSTGQFVSKSEMLRTLWGGAKIAAQVEREFALQIQRIVDLGVIPTHCDSHHGMHKRPAARAALIAVLAKFGIKSVRNQNSIFRCRKNASPSVRLKAFACNAKRFPARMYDKTTKRLMTKAGIKMPDQKISRTMLVPISTAPIENMVRCIELLPCGTSEIVFHPGFPDSVADDNRSQEKMRRTDLEVALSPEVRDAIEEQGIRLVSFRDI